MKKFLRGRVAFDTETTGLNPWAGAKIFLLGLEDEYGTILFAEPGTKEWLKAKSILEDPKIEKIAWNAKFDIKMLHAHNINIQGKIHDAMLMTYMNNEYEKNLKLKDCALRHLNMQPDEENELKKELKRLKKENPNKEINYSHVPRKIMRKYLEGDLDRTMKMFWLMEHIITGPQRRVYEIERKVICNIVKMEEWGINIDKPYIKQKIKEFKLRIVKLDKKLIDIAGCNFNPASRKDMTLILESLGIDSEHRNKDGTMKLDVKCVDNIKDTEFMSTFIEQKNLNKLISTYFNPFLEFEVNNIIHPSFWPFGQEKSGIKTGRFSCTDPNFQNVPEGGDRGSNAEMNNNKGLVRRSIIPRPGYVFLFGDFMQIEFVIFGCNTGDETILSKLRAGIDFHIATAHLLYGKNCFDGKNKDQIKAIRSKAKELNFALIYGLGIKSLAQKLKVTLGEAYKIKQKYFTAIPAAKRYLFQCQVDLVRDGYVQDQFGRRYHVPKEKCYIAANALCQGPAALVMKNTINKVYDALVGLDAHPFITVHDDLGIEVKKNQVYKVAEILSKTMEDKENFTVPLKVSIDIAEKSWADKLPWKDNKLKWKTYRKKTV